jgi:hypothetical protein
MRNFLTNTMVNLMKERITLISECSVADSQGKEKKETTVLGYAWAYMAPVRCRQQKYSSTIPKIREQGSFPIFRVIIRKRANLHLFEDTKHPLNTLHWKHRTFSLISPFSSTDWTGSFFWTLCVEQGRLYG